MYFSLSLITEAEIGLHQQTLPLVAESRHLPLPLPANLYLTLMSYCPPLLANPPVGDNRHRLLLQVSLPVGGNRHHLHLQVSQLAEDNRHRPVR